MARKVIHGGLHAAGGRLDADDLQPEPDVDVMPGQLRDAGHGNGMIRKCGVGSERSARRKAVVGERQLVADSRLKRAA